MVVSLVWLAGQRVANWQLWTWQCSSCGAGPPVSNAVDATTYIPALICCAVLQVQVEVDKDSKQAKKAAQKSAAASTGLDAFLSQIEQKKKVRRQCET